MVAYSSNQITTNDRDQRVREVRLRDHRAAHRRDVAAGDRLALGEVDGGESRRRRPVVHRAHPGAQLADRRHPGRDRQHRARVGVDRVDPGDTEAHRVARGGRRRQRAGERTERDQEDVAHLRTLLLEAARVPIAAPHRSARRDRGRPRPGRPAARRTRPARPEDRSTSRLRARSGRAARRGVPSRGSASLSRYRVTRSCAIASATGFGPGGGAA